MSNAAPAIPQSTATATAPDDSLGIDRAFVLQMARMPVLALLWIGAAIASHHIWAAIWPEGLNAGPLVVISFGMILAAFIDGWALKVPNWITFPLVLSGWALGALHDFGVHADAGTGGFALAVLGTAFGFILLLPMLAIGGVGAGDVKMQMGFGAWAGAYFGTGATTADAGGAALHGMGVVFWAFCFGALAGGAFGLVIILLRRQFSQNAGIVREIMSDLQMFGTGQVSAASKRAHDRRSRWTKLPYGIPLCVGFLLYMAYTLLLVG
ncbi:prepilin peptidase [Gemmata sp. G18]|uniref:Prepilin peptidase n=1 Tax=Gemmata palustris TaxID=2822762 RepID=A0ABS5BJH5_9BACT|nr:A24 family peptidase [Gemmata palustris]MBP3953853.1 prepilin peptidase [Gemmata palustris]